jgi:predicted dehydrogenase
MERVTAPDAAYFVLELRGGALAAIQVSRFAPGNHLLQIDGSRGSVRSDGENVWIYEKIVTDHQQPVSEFSEVPPDDIAKLEEPDLFDTFVNCCFQGVPFEPDFQQGARIMKQLDWIYRKLDQGRP